MFRAVFEILYAGAGCCTMCEDMVKDPMVEDLKAVSITFLDKSLV